ncbi:hypothetical protein [Vibrio hepatarius]|uniref:hypothetical protein n=1 Tax=Vibrio hepatarius TaxID=171383 RepID=UPI0037357AD8
MRICEEKKIIFISKWKCGSEAVRDLLDPYASIYSSQNYPYYHHCTALELKEYLGDDCWAQYFSFVSVRNPWDMLVSLYIYSMPDSSGKYWWERHWDLVSQDIEDPSFFIPPKDLMPFSDWLRYKDLSKFTISNFAYDENGNCIVSKVIKMEDFETDLAFLEKDFDIKVELKSINKTRHLHYSYYYNDDLCSIVYEKFKDDIALGEYSFEDRKRSENDFVVLDKQVSFNSFYQLKKYASKFQLLYKESLEHNVALRAELSSIEGKLVNLEQELDYDEELFFAINDYKDNCSLFESLINCFPVDKRVGKTLVKIYFSSLFCQSYYEKQVGFCFSSRFKAVSHYINFGEEKFFKPNPFFDVRAMLEKDVTLSSYLSSNGGDYTSLLMKRYCDKANVLPHSFYKHILRR